jgi:hypothetical protein
MKSAAVELRRDDPVFMHDDGEQPRAAYEIEAELVSLDPGNKSTALHGMGGISFVYTPFIPVGHPNLRPVELTDALFIGNLGDDRHGSVHLLKGVRSRWPVEPHDNLFVEPRAQVILSSLRGPGPEVAWSFDAGVGVGYRLLGLATATAWASGTGAITEEFHNRNSPSTGQRWVGRFGLDAAIDICALTGLAGKKDDECRYRAPATRPVDLGPAMEAALAYAAQAAGGDGHDSPYCAQVRTAASAVRRLPDPECAAGPTAECLLAHLTRAEPSGGELRKRLEAASVVHGRLLACLRRNREQAVVAQRNGWLQRERLQYGAYPPEMVKTLGCEGTCEPDADLGRAVEIACGACPAACANQPWFQPP